MEREAMVAERIVDGEERTLGGDGRERERRTVKTACTSVRGSTVSSRGSG